MPKNRVIPFGYCIRNGEITAEPKEVYAVSTIFSEYLKGGSLLQIAKLMKKSDIPPILINGTKTWSSG